ncbi:MAG TPA: alpha/beta hydrolase [Candidatus Nanopelagicaceae bacterium]|nr:alpha/beta hydrolase [Candidatus Nanopelagicaceae bacterium]
MKLAYERKGSGSTLVLLHGLGSAATAWRTITPELEKYFDVIAFDLPGHGKTPYKRGIPMDPRSLGELVLQNLDELRIDRFHLVGNSLGGWICLEMAAAQPDRVNSVTALAPAGLWHHPLTKASKWTAINRTMAVLSLPFQPLLSGRNWAKRLAFKDTSPRWRDLPKQVCLDAGVAMGSSRGYFPAWEAILHRKFDSPIAPQIPVTVVFGDSDQTLPYPSCQARELAPPHAKWIILKDTGHAPMWDEPELIANLIRENGQPERNRQPK